MNSDALEKMLEQGQDNFLLRYGLGQALLKDGNASKAIPHLQAALKFDAQHSSSWKLLGKALALEGQNEQAIETFAKGISVAESRGDIQAVKEMKVFLKRLKKLSE
jgi:predicted Zn-dependent protease